MTNLYKSSILLILLLASCASPINQRNAAFYHEAGTQASAAGDYELAERNYERALINARLGNSPTAGISMAAYNLGRVKAKLCKFEEAETLLTEALTLEEQSSGAQSGLTTMRLFELARVKSAQGSPAAAAGYYDRAVENVRKLDIETSDPIGFSLVLDEYSSVLLVTGSNEMSATLSSEAKRLRADNPGRTAGFVPEDYGLGCLQDGT